jgi:hypothetical protein
MDGDEKLVEAFNQLVKILTDKKVLNEEETETIYGIY